MCLMCRCSSSVMDELRAGVWGGGGGGVGADQARPDHTGARGRPGSGTPPPAPPHPSKHTHTLAHPIYAINQRIRVKTEGLNTHVPLS